MKHKSPLRQLEEKLGCATHRPPLGKYETECTIFLRKGDFKRREDYVNCRDWAGVTRAAGEGVEAYISGQAIKATSGSYEDPPEGGYSEDVFVWIGDDDITEMLKEEVVTRCEQTHYEEAMGLNERDEEE